MLKSVTEFIVRNKYMQVKRVDHQCQ